MKSAFVVADTIYPATSGGRVRTSGIAAALDELGSVEVLALDELTRPDVWGAACQTIHGRRLSLRQRLIDRAVATARGTPPLLERVRAAGAVEAFASIVDQQSPDLIVLSRPCFGPFIDVALTRRIPVVLDVDESLVRANKRILRSKAPFGKRVRAVLDYVAALRFEAHDCRRVDQVWTGSLVEQEEFVKRLPGVSVQVVLNLAPPVTGGRVPGGPIRAIAYVGSYSYAPNEEAALSLMTDIMPAIRASGGPMELVLIGRDPTGRMLRAAERTTNVRITGLVPEVGPLLREAGVLVVPLRAGAGSRVKILEAMELGIPVVTTSRGLEGLTATPGDEVLIAETPEEFASAVARLQRDEALRYRLVAGAAAFVGSRHSQRAISAAVRGALASVHAIPPLPG